MHRELNRAAGTGSAAKEGHWVLITGCSTGIGESAAWRLRDRGYRVIATARHSDDVTRLETAGFYALQLDLDYPESVQQAVETVAEHTGGDLYGVFHNGAFAIPGAMEDLGRDALRAQFETNVFGWHDLTRRLIPMMRARGAGRIIYNSSVLGLVCMPYRGAYNASKFATEAIADTLRLELIDSGIHIVLIEPGPIRTAFRENAYRAFCRHIDRQASVHQNAYAAMIERLNRPGDGSRFTLGPEAVVDKLVCALEAARPRSRYYVTLPTHVLGLMRRILPIRYLDKLLRLGGA